MLRLATLRLSVLMFLEFATLGYTIVCGYYFTQVLHLSAFQAGLLASCPAIGMCVAPALSNLVSDKRISPARLFTILHLGSGAALWLAAGRTGFGPLFALLLASALLASPTMGLTHTLCFRYAASPDTFGFLRMWGTLGFVGAAWAVSVWLRLLPGRPFADVYRFAGAFSVLAALYALSLPTDRRAQAQQRGEVREALRRPVVLWLVCVVAAVLFLQRFYHLGAGPDLARLGVSQAWIPPALTAYQVLEVGVLLALGALVRRFGRIQLVFAGLALQVALFALLGLDRLPWVLTGLVLYGFKFPFVIAVAYMILDEQTSPRNQHDLHQLFMLLTFGVGELLGNWLAGLTLDALGILRDGSFPRLWALASGASVVLLAVAAGSWAVIARARPPAPALDPEAAG